MSSSRDAEFGYSERTPILHTDNERNSRDESSACSRFYNKVTRPWKRLSNAIPARYAFAIISSFGFFNVYAMRVNLSVAMVAMVGKAAAEHSSDDTACVELLSPANNTTIPLIPTYGEFDWSSSTQSQILGAFFIGYVITQIPGGILAEKYGSKWLFGVGVLITAIFTLLTPLAARHSVEALIAVRVIEGLGEGVTFPAMNALIGKWVPKLERSRISTIIYTGSPIGTVVAMAVSGFLSSSETLGGWPMVFYLFGTLGCIWFVFWICLVYESPEEHPRISKAELEYIQSSQDKTVRNGRMPWGSVFVSPPFLALIITHFGFNWGFYTLLTELPTYLSNVLHFDLKQNGFLSAAPYLFQAIFGFLASFVADGMRASPRFKNTFIRKLMNSVAFYLPGIFVLAITLTGCKYGITVGLIIASVAFSGFMYSGFNVTHVDMSPEFAGTLMGITNCVANLSGFLAPAYVGWAIKDGHTLQNWDFVFITTALVYFVSGTVYNIFASAELQPWGVSQPVLPAPDSSTQVAASSGQVPQDKPTNDPPSETLVDSP